MKKSMLFSTAVFFVLIFSLFSFPYTAFAETGTLGTESPYLYAEYFTENGEKADGNALSSGNYKMQLVLKGMQAVSEMEFTASYGSEITFGEYSTIADVDSSVNTLCKIENGSLILCFVSLNEDCTKINPNGTVLFSADIAVKTEDSVDMELAVPVFADSDYFFIEADYGDIVKSAPSYAYDCYGLSSDNSHSGTVYAMECDLSPLLNNKAYIVSAYIGALAQPTDSFGTYPVTGAIVTVGEKSAVTDINGQFVIDGLESGTYEATVTYKYGFTRTFTIVVSDSDVVSDIMVGIVGCDLSGDGMITTSDYSLYSKKVGATSGSSNYELGYDFNRDTLITSADYAIYSKFVGCTSSNMIYYETVIKN